MENRSVVAKDWWGRGGADYTEAPKGTLQGAGNVLHGAVMIDTSLYSFVKTQRLMYPKSKLDCMQVFLKNEFTRMPGNPG